MSNGRPIKLTPTTTSNYQIHSSNKFIIAQIIRLQQILASASKFEPTPLSTPKYRTLSTIDCTITPSCCLINIKILDTTYRCYAVVYRPASSNFKIFDTKDRCIYSCTPSCFPINTKILDTKYQCLYCCISVTKSAVVHCCIWYIHFTPSY